MCTSMGRNCFDAYFQVLREEEDAAAARAVNSAVEKNQTQSLSKVSPLTLCSCANTDLLH